MKEYNIVRTRNLWQVVKVGIGTVYQAQSKNDALSFIERHTNRCVTFELGFKRLSDTVYGRGNITRVRACGF